jgi:hypothetical protein
MNNKEILDMNEGKKFDIILANPPYTGILHMKFLEKFMQIISDNGNIIQISPNIFLKHVIAQKVGNYRNMLNGNLKDIDIIKHNEANRIFNLGHSINELAIYNIQKNTKNPIDVKLFGFENKIERNIFEKLLVKRDGKLGWENKNTKRHGEQKGYFVNLYTWHVGHNAYTTCINESNKFSRTVYFDNETQVKNFKESFNTNFMEYYCREIVWAGNGITDKCFMFDKKYYNKPLNDKFFFNFFNINKEEQEYILNKVKNYDK